MCGQTSVVLQEPQHEPSYSKRHRHVLPLRVGWRRCRTDGEGLPVLAQVTQKQRNQSAARSYEELEAVATNGLGNLGFGILEVARGGACEDQHEVVAFGIRLHSRELHIHELLDVFIELVLAQAAKVRRFILEGAHEVLPAIEWQRNRKRLPEVGVELHGFCSFHELAHLILPASEKGRG